MLVSCLLATGVAGVAFVLLPSITQGIAFHLGKKKIVLEIMVYKPVKSK